jgi:hypothetical protein
MVMEEQKKLHYFIYNVAMELLAYLAFFVTLALSGKGKYLNFQTCDLHRFLIFTLYAFSDTISEPSDDRYSAVGSNTIFTTSGRGRTIGKSSMQCGDLIPSDQTYQIF